jgi:hypothetical protein
LSCSSNPQNPYSNPDNVTIALLLPDSTQTVYDGDTISVSIMAKLTSLIDSIVLTQDTLHDTSILLIQNTMSLRLAFNDTGSETITATAYCKNSVIKYCQGIIHVHKNPLQPPDTIYTKALSDTETFLYWGKISIAKKYLVFRSISTDTASFSLLTTVMDTFCTDHPLSASTTYYYRIASVDSINRKSNLSEIYKETTLNVPQSKWNEMFWDNNKWE